MNIPQAVDLLFAALPPPPGEPTAEEIRQMCAEIQSQWTRWQTRRAAGLPLRRTYRVRECRLVVRESLD